MNDKERITYEEFMLMFKNAPKLAYMLYDKAEDEIDRLNNIINSYENMKKELLDYIYHNEYCRFGHIDGGEADEMREIISKTDILKALKEGK